MATTTINEVTVGYWGLRARAGIVRSLLAYCGIPFQNKIYSSQDEWYAKDKKALGVEFPNLPYLIDGDKTITETSAIIKYIPLRAGRRDLLGSTDDDFIKVETALGVTGDLKTNLTSLVWTKGNFQAEKEDAFTKGVVKNKLEVLNDALEGKDWLCGFLSIADFNLFEGIDLIYELESSRLSKYPNLVTFHKRFVNLPEIKAHRQSDKFLYVWSFPGVAAWCNEKSKEEDIASVVSSKSDSEKEEVANNEESGVKSSGLKRKLDTFVNGVNSAQEFEATLKKTKGNDVQAGPFEKKVHLDFGKV